HKANDGYPFYYEYSRDNFYIRQWFEENPKSMGYVMIAARGTGRSNEELACVLNRATFFHKHRAAFQGKHVDDSFKTLIQSKSIPLFNAYPKFFKPEFSHGTESKGALIFTRPSIKGKESKNIEFGPDYELNSMVFAAGPGEKVLDRETLADCYCTEIGKTDPK